MSDPDVRQVRTLLGRRIFVEVPFRIHKGDPGWVPPLRMSVHDRISPRHPAMSHQKTALWIAYRRNKPVGRIAACVDSTFDRHQGERWGWVGFFDCFDDPQVANAMFDTACRWAADMGAETCVGPANFTSNDEIGLLVEGFDDLPSLMTLQNPRYYERLWTDAGWAQAMDLWMWTCIVPGSDLSERQRRALDWLQTKGKLRVRALDMKNFDAKVGTFFEVYNAAWEQNWGFAPMSEPEIRHLAKQLKPIINPAWAFGVETEDGTPVGVCLALPDYNQPMTKVRSGRLLPTGWLTLVLGRRKIDRVRVWALGVRPEFQHLAVGSLLYREITDRVTSDPKILIAECGWTLASNHKINRQIEELGGKRTKTWRLYQRPARAY